MIIGIGTDITSIARINSSIEKFGDKFLNRIFTQEEQAIGQKFISEKRRISFYAKRFAAKEAFAKALGQGIGKNVSFIDISILRDKYNKPQVRVNSKVKNFLQQIVGFDKEVEFHISLSDDHNFANAIVIVETKERTYATSN